MNFLGIDIGGTKCSLALVDNAGTIVDKIYTCAHVEQKDEDGMVAMIAAHAKELLARNGLEETHLPGIGVGCAGHIRYEDGVIITTSNMEGFDNYPMRARLQEHFRVPVVLDNDTNVQALGEHFFGAGRSGAEKDMVFVTVSTGIGAGIILDGKVYRGRTGTAGEIGHCIVEPDSELTCTCGNKGCLMAVACGMALPHLFRKRLLDGEETLLDMPPKFNLSKINGQTLKKGLDIGDPVSKGVIGDSGRYVGIGIYNLWQTLNVPLIVIGGGLTNWGQFYLDRIKETFYSHARDMLIDPVEITLSRIVGDAGVIGAAALTMDLAHVE
ncbi:MAG: ROK family protein [Bacteroidales bacterium]